MPYFQPGDTVHIRSDLETRVYYRMDGNIGSRDIATRNMVEYAGREVTITGVRWLGGGYTVEGPDDGLKDWLWTDEMFDEYIHRKSEPHTETELVANDDSAILEFISANKI